MEIIQAEDPLLDPPNEEVVSVTLGVERIEVGGLRALYGTVSIGFLLKGVFDKTADELAVT